MGRRYGLKAIDARLVDKYKATKKTLPDKSGQSLRPIEEVEKRVVTCVFCDKLRTNGQI
jgi:hypothetical protein